MAANESEPPAGSPDDGDGHIGDGQEHTLAGLGIPGFLDPTALLRAVEEHLPLPSAVENSAFDPTPEPGADRAGGPPPRWWGNHLGELRWQAEFYRLLADPVYRGRGVPAGDGSPVLLIPGFLAGDSSLAVMRGWLRRLGYEAHRSGIAMNVDCSDRTFNRLEHRLEAIATAAGQPVAVVGHSRGGHFAKALTRRRPELVSTAVSLGSGLDSPFDISVPTKAAVAGVRIALRARSERAARRGCFTDTCDCPFTRDFAGPLRRTVPLTSIYSRGDGVVRWRACVVPYATCIEVAGSHVGLAFNRKVYRHLAQLMADRPHKPLRVPTAAHR